MINPVVSTSPSSAQNASGQKSSPSTVDGFSSILSGQITRQTDKTTANENNPAPQTDANATTSQAANTQTASDSQTSAEVGIAAARKFSALLFKKQPHATSKNLVNETVSQVKTPPAIDAGALISLLPSAVTTTQAASTDTKIPKDKTLAVPDASIPLANPNISIASVFKTDLNIDAKLLIKPGVIVDTSTLLKTTAQQSGSNSAIPLTDPKNLTPPVLVNNTQTVKTVDLLANLPSEQALLQTAGTQLAATLAPNITGNSQQNTIAAPLGSTAWPDEFSQKISWVSTQQSQIAELHLNPPDLGPMSVVLSVTNNQATALFTSPHAEVRQAIESALPQLRERLADNGIMLGNATVSDQTPRDSGAGNFTKQQNTARIEIANLSAIESSSVTTAITRQYNGLLDTFA